MLGKCYSLTGQKFNVICLACGSGDRMGIQSDYIPKALSKIGDKRSISYIIDRYEMIAYKFIIGVSCHSDLLTSYLKGNYPKHDIDFTYQKPENLINNAISTLYCLDLADSRYPTIIVFCDLLILGNFNIHTDSVLLASETSKGQIGSFRHSYDLKKREFIKNTEAIKPEKDNYGVLGCFIIEDTTLLKSIAYTKAHNKELNDLTEDIIMSYHSKQEIKGELCEKVIEFGTEIDLQTAREMWEKVI